MTAEQFCAYARERLSPDALADLRESIAEHNGEVAAFGDAGPGSFARLAGEVRSLMRIERQLARLEGREPRDLYLRLRLPA